MRVQDLEAQLASVSGDQERGTQDTSLGNIATPIPDGGDKPDNDTSPIPSSCGVSNTDSLCAPSITESLPDVRATDVFDQLQATDIGYFGEHVLD
jgi:hypothetical protein